MRDCRLVGLLDLALEKTYVRGKVTEYLNKLIDMGVAGFRVDACKHMWPGDLQAIYSQLRNLNTKWFPTGSRPFIFQEVLFFCLKHTLCVTVKYWVTEWCDEADWLLIWLLLTFFRLLIWVESRSQLHSILGWAEWRNLNIALNWEVLCANGTTRNCAIWCKWNKMWSFL